MDPKPFLQEPVEGYVSPEVASAEHLQITEVSRQMHSSIRVHAVSIIGILDLCSDFARAWANHTPQVKSLPPNIKPPPHIN